MKKLVQSDHLVFFLIFFAYSCSPTSTQVTKNAIITGFDKRMCLCCGGLMITFSNDTIPYHSPYKNIFNDAATGISEKDTFPINAYVEYYIDSTSACKPVVITKFIRE